MEKGHLISYYASFSRWEVDKGSPQKLYKVNEIYLEIQNIKKYNLRLIYFNIKWNSTQEWGRTALRDVVALGGAVLLSLCPVLSSPVHEPPWSKGLPGDLGTSRDQAGG